MFCHLALWCLHVTVPVPHTESVLYMHAREHREYVCHLALWCLHVTIPIPHTESVLYGLAHAAYMPENTMNMPRGHWIQVIFHVWHEPSCVVQLLITVCVYVMLVTMAKRILIFQLSRDVQVYYIAAVYCCIATITVYKW